jgi:putative nucleotidyltransferase with HDIG domain
MDDNEKLDFDRIIDWIRSGKLQLSADSPTILKIHGMNEHNIDVVHLEQMILDDQVLAMEVLRTANSPFYCNTALITTVRSAIMRLGTQTIKRIIILSLERARYRSRFQDLHEMLIKLWLHVSMTALSAQWLAQRLCLSSLEVCFLGGLMHDIGKLVIICVIEEMRKTGSVGKTMSGEALQEFIKNNHCSIGYEIMQRWEIPDVYCRIARDHHKEEFSAEDLPLLIVRLANNSSSLSNEDLAVALLAETPERKALSIEDSVLRELQETLSVHKEIAS